MPGGGKKEDDDEWMQQERGICFIAHEATPRAGFDASPCNP